MPESPIRKLVPYAEAAKQLGKTVYHLNIGQPDILTPPEAMHAIRNIAFPVIEYSHSAGFLSYRKRLLEYYDRCGIGLRLEDLIVTTGGSEAILFGMLSCLNPGDEIIIPEPFYANYNGFAIAGDIVVKPITSHIEDGFALPSIQEFEKLISSKTKAIMICNPNNPTGYLYSHDELEGLRQLVIDHDLYLFADEVYREFTYDGRQHFSVLNLEGLEQHVVLMDSISKRYSACGARVGVLISRNPEVMKAAMKFAQARLSPPTLGQIVGEASISASEAYFLNVYNEYIQRRDLVVQEMNTMEGVICPTPGGAFYAMAKLPIDDCEQFCKWLLQDFDLEGETLMLAPGSGFYATPGLGKQEVRIAYVLGQERLYRAMRCLREALLKYPGRTMPADHPNAVAGQQSI